ncbi:MAG: hypothetical protein KGM47_02970 [Acidobacteriota bacterium]|nr:hypothetical protein [Acidobacteriota bacterium]
MMTQRGIKIRAPLWPAIRSLGFGLALTVFLPAAAFPAAATAGARPYLQIFCNKYSQRDPRIPPEVRKSLQSLVALSFTDSRGRLWQATPRGLIEIQSAPNGKRRRLLTGADGLPVTRLTGIAGGPDGRIWLASREGAICFLPDAPPSERWFYFWGKRYLASNRVLQIVAGKDAAWIRTPDGISLIAFKPYNLDQKSGVFLARLRARHLRYGYVDDCELASAADITSCRTSPSDNDGLWTSIYVAAECFRYAATHSPQALQNARESLAAMLRLVSITGIPGFPARALNRRGDYRDPGGEWHSTPDGAWEWKGDTSSDEITGHFFAYSVAYRLLPGNGDKAAIRDAVSSIAEGLIDHDYKLVGYGGRVTTWGRYDPQYFKTAKGRDDKALDSLELLSHLRVAYQITGNPKFLAAYRRVATGLGYAGNVMHIGDSLRVVNYSDEELAFLCFYPLLQAETNPQLRQQYQEALARLWRRVRTENNPLWNFIYAQCDGAANYGRSDAIRTLELIPMSAISWSVKNSQRADLVRRPGRGRHGELQSISAIPPEERYVMKWNGDPFQMDGGDGGKSEDDGAFFLLPYWFGRYYHLLNSRSEKE